MECVRGPRWMNLWSESSVGNIVFVVVIVAIIDRVSLDVDPIGTYANCGVVYINCVPVRVNRLDSSIWHVWDLVWISKNMDLSHVRNNVPGLVTCTILNVSTLVYCIGRNGTSPIAWVLFAFIDIPFCSFNDCLKNITANLDMFRLPRYKLTPLVRSVEAHEHSYNVYFHKWLIEVRQSSNKLSDVYWIVYSQ